MYFMGIRVEGGRHFYVYFLWVTGALCTSLYVCPGLAVLTVVFLNQGTVLISQGNLRRQHFCLYQLVHTPFIFTVLKAAMLAGV